MLSSESKAAASGKNSSSSLCQGLYIFLALAVILEDPCRWMFAMGLPLKL